MLKKKGEPLVLLPARALKQSIQHQTHSVTDPLSQRSSLTRGPRPIHSLKRPLEIGSAMYMKEDIPSQSKKSSACRCVFFYVHCINVHCVRVCVCVLVCVHVCVRDRLALGQGWSRPVVWLLLRCQQGPGGWGE